MAREEQAMMSRPGALPTDLVDASGMPRCGAYEGPLGEVRLEGLRDPRLRRALWRRTHLKRWMYVVVASEQHLVAAAVVHLGYLANAFVLALDRRARTMLLDRSSFTLAALARVGPKCEEGCDVRFRGPGARLSFLRAPGTRMYAVEVCAGALELRANLSVEGAPRPIAVVAPVRAGLVNVTQKRVLLPTRGDLVVGSRAWRLDGAVAGLDYTFGYLARHTAWRWAFALGRTTDGRPVAINLVEGFNDDLECAVWLDGELRRVAGASFSFEPERLLAPWRVRTADGAVDVRFVGDAMHRDETNLGIVRSRFAQPAGAFSGRLALPGLAPASIDNVAGVVETQDVTW
jgi:hypothetical protein